MVHGFTSSKACGNPPMPPALEGEFLTTASRKAYCSFFIQKMVAQKCQVSWPKSRASWSVEDYVIVNF